MKFAKVFLVIVFWLWSCSLVVAEEIDSATAYKRKLNYWGFKKIEGFGRINVYLSGSAKEVGLSYKELEDYVKLKFKNNFAGIKMLTSKEFVRLCSEGKVNLFYCTSEKIGYILFNIFTVGDDYPIAYHVRCKVGHIKDMPILESGLHCSPIIWENEVLGFCSKKHLPDAIKKILSETIEKLAVDFFKARGEL